MGDKKDIRSDKSDVYGASDEAGTRNRHPTNSLREFAGTLPDLQIKRRAQRAGGGSEFDGNKKRHPIR